MVTVLVSAGVGRLVFEPIRGIGLGWDDETGRYFLLSARAVNRPARPRLGDTAPVCDSVLPPYIPLCVLTKSIDPIQRSSASLRLVWYFYTEGRWVLSHMSHSARVSDENQVLSL